MSSSADEETPLLRKLNSRSKRAAAEENAATDVDQDAKEPLPVKKALELMICVFAFTARGLCMNGIGPTLLDLRYITGTSVAQSAWIFVSQSLGFLIGCLPAKLLLRRYNTEMVISLFLLIQAACSALTAQFQSLTLMCLMFFGQGFTLTITGLGVMAMCLQIGGTSRTSVFLQCIYLGTSVGSVIAPFIARPFLSEVAVHSMDTHVVIPGEFPIRLSGHKTHQTYLMDEGNLTTGTTMATRAYNTTTYAPDHMEDLNSSSHVEIYYLMQAGLSALSAILFLLLFIIGDKSIRQEVEDSECKQSSGKGCTTMFTVVVTAMFLTCMVYYGVLDLYSNLLTTFAVLGPLHLAKSQGVYLTSIFWASMCFGRLNGIWIARLLTPFEMLMVDTLLAVAAAGGLLGHADKAASALWGFTVMLGLSLATINGALVSWTTRQLPDTTGIMTMMMVARCAGLLTFPTTVTAFIKIYGTMTIMYCLIVSLAIMPIALGITHILLQRYAGSTQTDVSEDKISTDCSDTYDS